MYMAKVKEPSFDLKKREDAQLTLSLQITKQLSKDMKQMTQVLTESILEGMIIDFRK